MHLYQNSINPQNLLNSSLLKTMKQKVLKQAYDQELNKKSEKTTIATNQDLQDRQQDRRIRISHSVGDLTKSYRILSGSKKINDLSRDYMIYPHSLEKRQKSRKSLMQQKDFLSDFQKICELQTQKNKIARENYKKQLQQQIKRKQSQKLINKISQKQFERSKLNRQDSINNKVSSFKEFYDNANKFRDNAARQYLQYINKSKQKQQKQKQRQKYDLQQNRNLLKVQMLEQYKQKREKRQQLKRTLEQQMIESRDNRQSQLNQFKNRGYIRYDSNNYNPIYNPIDFKMDLNNKYVINEIMNKNVDYKL